MFRKFHILFLLFATFIEPGAAASSTWSKDSHVPSNCPNNLTLAVFADPPYTSLNRTDGVMSDFIILGLKNCFKSKSCTMRRTAHIKWKWVQSIDELEDLIINEQTNLAFPIPPSLSTRRTRLSVKAKVKYYSVLHSPGPALVVNYQACQRASNLILIKTILSVWPILLLTLLLAGISGVCIWALEYRNDQRQFSKPFVKGSYDGFWWAVVSMTTVGYGDQIPQSIVGRLFGIVWILTGVTLIAVFTALITSAITVVSVKESCNGIQGQHIGVVNNSEVEIIARHHGAIVKAYDDVMAMFHDLTSEKVNGILMDRPKAYYYLDMMDEDRLRVSRVLQSPLYYSIAVVLGNATGTITSNRCFMDLLENPTGKMNRIMKRYIVPVKPLTSTEDAFHVFSGDSIAMTNTLLTITVLLVVLLMCGLVWDRLFKRKSCCQQKNVRRRMLTNFNDLSMESPSSVDQLAQVHSALKRLSDQILELKETVGAKSQDIAYSNR